MLVGVSAVEQRYQAAVIRDGVPIVQVARRFDVSRQAVHRWLRWYEAQGLPGLVDRFSVSSWAAPPGRRTLLPFTRCWIHHPIEVPTVGDAL
jgi:transposase-like protein